MLPFLAKCCARTDPNRIGFYLLEKQTDEQAAMLKLLDYCIAIKQEKCQITIDLFVQNRTTFDHYQSDILNIQQEIADKKDAYQFVKSEQIYTYFIQFCKKSKLERSPGKEIFNQQEIQQERARNKVYSNFIKEIQDKINADIQLIETCKQIINKEDKEEEEPRKKARYN
ncbi:MAG: hypothetical protein WD055_01005 [Candidatus Dependentiae bacterium]